VSLEGLSLQVRRGKLLQRNAIIPTSTVKEAIVDEVASLVNGHGGERILMVLQHVADASLKAFHDSLNGLTAISDGVIKPNNKRFVNGPILSTEFTDSEGEVIQRTHRLVSHIASLLQLGLDLVGELVKVTTLRIIEQDLACLDAMGKVCVIRAKVVANLDHDIDGSILNVGAATATLEPIASLVALIEFALTRVDRVNYEVGDTSHQLLSEKEGQGGRLATINLDRGIPVLWVAGGTATAQKELNCIARDEFERLSVVGEPGSGNAGGGLRPAGARPDSFGLGVGRLGIGSVRPPEAGVVAHQKQANNAVGSIDNFASVVMGQLVLLKRA
jgi:hypothetical protein